MRFIVTGTPRSATKYAARLLSALGVMCTHETHLRPLATVVDCLRWWAGDTGGESSWMAWTLLPLFPESVPVLHTIRNPWHVIDSLSNRNSILKDRDTFKARSMLSVRDTIAIYAPRVWTYERRIDRAAAFVVDWNAAIEKALVGRQRFTYHVDRLSTRTIGHLLRTIGAERTADEIDAALAEVKTDTNAGYTITETEGVSNPLVAEWIKEYAEKIGAECIFSRKIKNQPDRETMEQLAERMDPELLHEVNQFADLHGYPTAAAILR